MQEILNSMRERMPWTVARLILISAGIEPGQGWEKTLKKYKGQDLEALKGSLLDRVQEHNLCGEKFTKIFEVTEDIRAALQAKLLSLDVEDSEFSKVYPLAVPSAEIQSLGKPSLVSVEKNSDGVGAIYAHAVRLTTREQIDLDEWVDDPAELHKQYDEVVGLKFRTVQLFSVIWVPHEHCHVEIRTDLPDGMSMDMAHAIQSTMRKTANELGAAQLETPTDLYPLLEAIYEADGEGTVVELGFSTTTASVKNEKMRRRMLDLRKEPYHLSGKKGLGTPIEPFRLFVRWHLTMDGLSLSPELGLVGTARGRSSVGSPGAVGISGAVIRNCAGRMDFEHVTSKIREYLEQLRRVDEVVETPGD